MNIKQYLKDKYDYLLIALFIFFSDATFWCTSSNVSFLADVRFYFDLALPVIMFILLKGKVAKTTITPVIIIGFVLMLASLVSGSFSGGPIVLVLVMFSASMIVQYYSFERFAYLFDNFITALCVYSLFLYFLVVAGVVSGNSVSNAVGVPVIQLGGLIFFGNDIVIRLSSIFREPGVFMIYINLAYMFNIMLDRRISTLRLAVYIMAIIATVSTAGIIIFALLSLIYFRKSAGLNMSFVFYIALIGLGAYFLMSNEALFDKFFGKLDSDYEGGTTIARISSLVIPFYIAINNPLVGCGIDHFKDQYIAYGNQIFHLYLDPQGSGTNTLMNMAAMFGIWFGLWALYELFKLTKRYGKRPLAILLLLLSLLFMFSNENMTYNVIFYIIIYYGLHSKSLARNYAKNNNTASQLVRGIRPFLSFKQK